MAFLDETGLAELWSLIQESDAELARADVTFAVGSYTGTGTYGSSNPNSLTFDFVPKVVFIVPDGSHSNGGMILLYGATKFGGFGTFYTTSGTVSAGQCNITWNGTTVSWYNPASSINDAAIYEAQQNKSGMVYRYLAFA